MRNTHSRHNDGDNDMTRPKFTRQSGIDAAVARIQELAVDGIAPPRSIYAVRHNQAPGVGWLHKNKIDYGDLCAMAGLRRSNKSLAAADARRFRQRRLSNASVPPATEAEIERMSTAAAPPEPRTWPLFGIPTRTETVISRLDDGTAIRTTRQYYSLR